MPPRFTVAQLASVVVPTLMLFVDDCVPVRLNASVVAALRVMMPVLVRRFVPVLVWESDEEVFAVSAVLAKV